MKNENHEKLLKEINIFIIKVITEAEVLTDFVIRTKLKDPVLIENTLDSILECIIFGEGVELFERLNHYYSSISEAQSISYCEKLKIELGKCKILN